MVHNSQISLFLLISLSNNFLPFTYNVSYFIRRREQSRILKEINEIANISLSLTFSLKYYSLPSPTFISHFNLSILYSSGPCRDSLFFLSLTIFDIRYPIFFPEYGKLAEAC